MKILRIIDLNPRYLSSENKSVVFMNEISRIINVISLSLDHDPASGK